MGYCDGDGENLGTVIIIARKCCTRKEARKEHRKARSVCLCVCVCASVRREVWHPAPKTSLLALAAYVVCMQIRRRVYVTFKRPRPVTLARCSFAHRLSASPPAKPLQAAQQVEPITRKRREFAFRARKLDVKIAFDWQRRFRRTASLGLVLGHYRARRCDMYQHSHVCVSSKHSGDV